MDIFLVAIIGLVAGFISGAMGLSAGPILVPALLLFSLATTYKNAIGTTILTIIPPLSIFAVMNYYRHNYVNVRLALILMIFVIVGAFFGSQFTVFIKPRILSYMTGIILAGLSIFWFYCGYTGLFIDSKDIGAI